MAKKKTPQKDQLFDLHEPVQAMPDGYYSGDKPNPNLRKFIEHHATPYNPKNDDYSLPAFVTPITTTKATAIYNMHSYWSKKPHDAIRQYIQHYTQPGDIVLDPFCGSGGTALAALLEGRHAIATDRSPAATFITKNYCTTVDPALLHSAFEAIKKTVQSEIEWLYETKCDRCDGKAITEYTVYSQVFRCSKCLTKVALFDCVEVQGQTQAGKPKTLKACPVCIIKGSHEIIKSDSEKFGSIPVLVRYDCKNGCSPSGNVRTHKDSNEKKREYFETYDLGKIKEIETKPIPHWFPPHRMMNVEGDTVPWG